MDLEQEQNSGKKKWIIIAVGVLIIIAIVALFFIRSQDGTTIATRIGDALPFGDLGSETSREITGVNGSSETNPEQTTESGVKRPMFLQLAQGPIAGSSLVTRDGKQYVRYVLKENGFVYEVDPETATSKQLTNTTIPKVYEAFFGNEGNTVVLRYLKRDPLSRIDVIKSYVANLVVPTDTTQGVVGSLQGEYLPDNITALSVSPNGANLFYLLPVSDGVSGTVVPLILNTPPKEVFRNSFSEWLPQLLNDGTIILTTKASAKIPGYAYAYDPKNKTLSRILREKNGLTTMANPNGSMAMYNENIVNTATFGIYNKNGFAGDEGIIEHEAPIPLTTLPDKCAWANAHKEIYCGAFVGTGYNDIPDTWYQGVTTFKDTIWRINTDTQEVSLLADPKDAVQKYFDIISPYTDAKDEYLIFTDKNDSSLWSYIIPKSTAQENTTIPTDNPALTPEEQKDAAGSVAN